MEAAGCTSRSLDRSLTDKTELWLRLKLVALAGLMAMISLQGSKCLGATSEDSTENIERPFPTVTELPFQLYNDNLIVVKGSIGPISGVNLILDTGTTPSAISKGIATRLKLRGNAEPLQTLNGAVQTQSFILPSIRLSAIFASEIRVVVQDLGVMEQSLGISIAGIVGLDVLRTHNFTIDYRKKKISFGLTTSMKNSVHFETQYPLLMVKANLQGHDFRLIVDSGTSGMVIFRNRINQTTSALRSLEGTFIATVAGAPQAKFFRTSITLAEQTSEHVIAIADVDVRPEDSFDGLLGFTGMGFRRVSFDFENGTLGWES